MSDKGKFHWSESWGKSWTGIFWFLISIGIGIIALFLGWNFIGPVGPEEFDTAMNLKIYL